MIQTYLISFAGVNAYVCDVPSYHLVHPVCCGLRLVCAEFEEEALFEAVHYGRLTVRGWRGIYNLTFLYTLSGIMG